MVKLKMTSGMSWDILGRCVYVCKGRWDDAAAASWSGEKGIHSMFILKWSGEWWKRNSFYVHVKMNSGMSWVRLVHVVSRTLYNILIVVESSKQGLYNRFITFLKTRDISNPGQQALFRQIKKAVTPHFLPALGPWASLQLSVNQSERVQRSPARSSSSPCPHFKHLP